MLKKARGLVTKKMGRLGLLTKKRSPEMLVGFGVVCVVAGTVSVAKSTLKFMELNEDKKEKLWQVDQAEINEIDDVYTTVYNTEDAKEDRKIIYTKFVIDVAKTYASGALLVTMGLGALIGSNKILKKRNLALMSAYKGLDEVFKRYRREVEETFGEQIDKMKTKYEKDVEKHKEGDPEPKRPALIDPNTYSQYAKIFGETNQNYVRTPEYNMLFLKTKQSYFNDLLRARGHVFLNEVYKELGFRHTKAGAVCGWVLSEDSDNFVDFGLYNKGSWKAVDFVNGYESAIVLDFNVDGVIFDKI